MPIACLISSVHDTISDTCSAPWIAANDLACRRGNQWLFRSLSFSIFPGQLVWLRGANGSGKTTLLRAVVGLSQPDLGTLVRAVPDGVGDVVAERTVYIGHLNAMKDDLTVCESLQFIASLHGLNGSRKSAVAALETLGMHHRRNASVRTLSQGQRRRAALARLAMEIEPSLWVLDEPFDALDTQGIQTINAILLAHLERGGGVLLTSHLELEAAGPRAIELMLEPGATA